MRRVRRDASRLGLDVSHFKATRARVEGHAIRLGLNVKHLNIDTAAPSDPSPSRVIAGRVGLGLRTYTKYIVGNAAGVLGPGVSGGRPTAVVSQSA
jgi:hypothetical protein